MRVSVVIPVYNRQALCERALGSVLAQPIDGMEVIIVDDGSQPPFELPSDIAADARVRLIRHARNGGESVARNSGLGAAHAEWIAFLDSDDYWLADTLRPRLEAAEMDRKVNPNPMILYSAGFAVDNKRTGRRQARIPRESQSPIDFASGCWFAPGSTILFRRELVDRIGTYDPMLQRLVDFDWYLRFALAGGRLKVWNDLAAVIETGPKPQISALEESAAYLRTKYSGEGSAHPLAPVLLRRLNAYLDIERASIFAAQGRWLRMLSCLWRSLLRVPRLTLHLERFWRPGILPRSLEPAQARNSAP